jgi:cytochrome c-type biogenesis protein CcmH
MTAPLLRGMGFLLFLLAIHSSAADDPALQRRAQALEKELRCLVCQNQTLAESNAPLAVDLRNQVRAQLAQGKSDREVIDWLVARYGDFVLYRPPLQSNTVLLWAGPFIFLLGGFYALARFLRRRRVPAPALTPAERAEAAKLLQ